MKKNGNGEKGLVSPLRSTGVNSSQGKPAGSEKKETPNPLGYTTGSK